MNPEEYGYELIDGRYYPKWHDGDIVPFSIESITPPSSSRANNQSEEEEELSYDSEEDETADDVEQQDLEFE